MGEDHVLWGSDYPHIDSTLDAPRLIRENAARLSPGRARKLMGYNARSLFAA
jgi:predicted TIM-barrel fold metal-dependent hydrolase